MCDDSHSDVLPQEDGGDEGTNGDRDEEGDTVTKPAIDDIMIPGMGLTRACGTLLGPKGEKNTSGAAACSQRDVNRFDSQGRLGQRAAHERDKGDGNVASCMHHIDNQRTPGVAEWPPTNRFWS
jgi:hypothetical protein